MEPLACRLRPKTFDDIIGQDHLVGANGVIRKMCDNNKLFSLILHGDPGIGKTSIANVIASYYALNVFEFNASVDNKAKLKDISEAINFYPESVLIIDEIHRMKKDIQDFLLPYVEKGQLIIIGLTTVNPYQSINPAIRSRCHIYKLNPIKKDDIIKLLKRVLNKEFSDIKMTDEVFDYVATASNGEIRTALNMLEAITLLGSEKEIILDDAVMICGRPSLKLDKGEDNYYDILSALQKSIRGSDVDAALHYLARLVTLEDIDIIARRLMVIAYEDIGLGNPYMGSRVLAACEVAKKLGFPEARIPLAEVVVELALSPKSNTAYSAFDKAMEEYQSLNPGEIPPHILNREIGHNGVEYKYPHDYPDHWVNQEYMPKNFIGHRYYEGTETGAYERQLKARYIELLKRKNRL